MKDRRPSEDPGAFLDSLTYDDTAPTPVLPPTSAELEQAMSVVRSLKMSPELDRRVKETAAVHGVTQSMLIRQYIEMGLAAEQPERMIPLSDAIRVLSNLRPSA
ncbi:hypothetical protein ACTD5D_14555 [Nocardia takedensis]|uniref:hypothetical protein n=1 Tax=Nocardia takedensis TaxID=259390 RepID=UPI0003159F4F|nr:hypothetical protein [Nocardia takedensis]